MIPSIHLHLDREAVRIRVWTDPEGLILASLTQGPGEVALRLRPDSAAALALALAQALRGPTDNGGGGAANGRAPVSHQLEPLGRRDLSACNAQAGRPAQGKEVLR